VIRSDFKTETRDEKSKCREENTYGQCGGEEFLFWHGVGTHKFAEYYIENRERQQSFLFICGYIYLQQHVKCERDSSYACVLNRYTLNYISYCYIYIIVSCILHVLIMYENSMNHVRVNSAAVSNELYAIAAIHELSRRQ